MFRTNNAYGGFSVDDLNQARDFYARKLGLQVSDEGVGLRLVLPGGGSVFSYPKADHQPATFTILNFVVDDIDEAVAALTGQGIEFERYADLTDDTGVARGLSRGMGPDIAWFKDPAGNILAVLQEE